MMMTGKELAALTMLLRLAREERAALREDLDDLGGARKAAEQSLSQVERLVGESGARRRRIMAMLATYEDAEAQARDKLSAALDRARWLEGLMALAGAEKLAGDPVGSLANDAA